ncbi:zf-HC2 domain-containing protein [Catenuloplanes atrovinosus]|uniref:Putative zinc-finger domain-containing protein n=1 Tax=Catenuloplanes atrovinosus TaxID=137266 RepID=A0AAE3YRV5_9ACTN|nr:zf-HC2 domain-containing protein [Catenuloplanes atrovinosus]MDR7277308.1 hypothetical protein [Catenuloplanes atrovinosus]
MREQLGFYVLGKLDETESLAVEEHVAECAACRAQLDELTDVLPALGGAPLADLRGLHHAQTTHGGLAARTVTAPPGGTRRPAFTDSAAGPPRSRGRRRRWAPVALVGILVIALAGISALVLWQPGRHVPRLVDSGSSASAAPATPSLSVTVADGPAGATVRCTLFGLTPGIRYAIHATLRNGRTIPLAELAGLPEVQKATGEVPAAPAEVVSVTVTDPAGAVVTSASTAGG